MCYLFPAAWYSGFRQLRGRISLGWLGGGARGWAHSFLNPRLMKVTYKIFSFNEICIWLHFFKMDFAISAAIVLVEVVYRFVCQHDIVQCHYTYISHPCEQLLTESVARSQQGFKLTNLLRITELEHNIGQWTVLSQVLRLSRDIWK